MKDTYIQWHPGFVGAKQNSIYQRKKQIHFYTREHTFSYTKPGCGVHPGFIMRPQQRLMPYIETQFCP